MVLSGRECLACTVPAEISQGEQIQRQSVQSKAAIGTDQLYLVSLGVPGFCKIFSSRGNIKPETAIHKKVKRRRIN